MNVRKMEVGWWLRRDFQPCNLGLHGTRHFRAYLHPFLFQDRGGILDKLSAKSLIGV